MCAKKAKTTKKKIVSAAWKLFYEQGYDNTTVDDIVEESGTSKGSFYHYFEGKDALLSSLSFLFAFAALAAPVLPLWVRLLIIARSLAIVASTMLVKQHMVIDAVTALPTAVVCWLLAGLVNVSSLAAKFS